MPDGYAELGKTVRLLIWVGVGAALLYWYKPVALRLVDGIAGAMANCNIGL